MGDIKKNCFKKVAAFSDIHLGMKQNSTTHNELCVEFVDWFIEQAHAEGAEICIFLGDWHHSRSTINVATMNYTLTCLQKLDDAFETVYFITGNHDLFYKESRSLNSVEFGRLFKNVVLISDPLTVGDVTFLPWMVGNEWKKVSKIKSKYIFGHLEIPKFKMNAMVEMPDTGEVQDSHFVNQDYVFSGHFHKRQQRGNIVYIGNPFPHNFSDAWDDERGMMILEWDGIPKFINFLNGPKFRTIGLTQLLSNPMQYIVPKTHAKITFDGDITYEEVNFIKEVLIKGMGASEVHLLLERTSDLENEFVGEIEFESVDDIVIKQLENIDSTTYDTKILINLYLQLNSD